MADSDVSLKSISLEMESDSAGAEKSIERLATSLLGLNKALGKIGNNSGNVRALLKSLSSLNGFSFANVEQAVNRLQALSRINFKRLQNQKLSIDVQGLDKVDPDRIQSITTGLVELSASITTLNRRGSVGKGLTSFLEAMNNITQGSLDEALGKLPTVVEQIRTFITEISTMPEVSENVVRLVEAYSRLSKRAKRAISAQEMEVNAEKSADQARRMATQSANKMIKELGRFGSVLKSSLVAGVQAFIKALGRLGSAVGTIVSKVRSVTSSLASMGATGFKTLISSIGDLGAKGVSGIKSFASQLSQLRKQTTGIGALTLSLKNLFGLVIGFRGITGIFNWLKEAVDSGANVAETNHIVEATFHDLSGQVDSWAKDAMENYGLAENSAKRYAGTLSAMFQASGIAYQDAAKMSTDMVGLAADLSSFYNIDQSVAYEKVKSGLAGMVRPLRDLGIDISVATLKEYALSQGIDKSWASMTQAEKVMLRYQYLLSVTTGQQGDFAATASKHIAA